MLTVYITEWSGERADGSSRKQPWLFETKSGEPMMFAGIWESCKTEDVGTIESFTIVTQPAGAPLNDYHDRAPVTLQPSEWRTWLDVGADVTHLLTADTADRFSVVRAEI